MASLGISLLIREKSGAVRPPRYQGEFGNPPLLCQMRLSGTARIVCVMADRFCGACGAVLARIPFYYPARRAKTRGQAMVRDMVRAGVFKFWECIPCGTVLVTEQRY